MSYNETKEQKRDRFKTNDDGDMLIIPPKAIYSSDVFSERMLRVAAYCRVSTPDEAQTSSFEIQKNYYESYIPSQPNWTYVGIYADEGISGTNRRKRDEFNRMIDDCLAGKIDLIITKSVSRFSRNVVDCLSVVRQLGALSPRVGVFFQTENINTLKKDNETYLTILAAFSQEESRAKSESMLWSYERRYSNQNFMTPTDNLLGYEKHDGQMVIEPEGAKTVRLIYAMFLAGFKINYIASVLTSLKRPTGKNNLIWSYSSVRGILRNERYCGDIVAQKTYTKDFLEHTKGQNRGQRSVYYKANHHEGIVSQDEYIQALLLLASKGKSKNPDYRLTVIREGLLAGFIPVNRFQGGYFAEQYIEAYEQANICAPRTKSVEIVNYPGGQLVRAQEFGQVYTPTVTVCTKQFLFNRSCINLLPSTTAVELLLHPSEKLLAVRPCSEDNPNAIQWRFEVDGKLRVKPIAAVSFTSVLYQLMGWDTSWRLRIQATPLDNGTEQVLIFDLRETEYQIYMEVEPSNEEQNENDGSDKKKKRRRKMTFLPQEWRDTFGQTIAEQAASCRTYSSRALDQWKTDLPGESVPGFERSVKQKSIIEIESMINELAADRH